MDPSKLTLISGSPVSQEYNLTGASDQVTDGTKFEFKFAMDDIDQIKLRGFTLNTNVFIRACFIADISGNCVFPSSSSLTTHFIPDTTQPSLMGYSVDLSTNNLTLTFSESVITTSFTVQRIIVQNSLVFPALRRQLTTSTSLIDVGSSLSQVISIELKGKDINFMKIRGLYFRQESGYLTIAHGAAKDASHNPSPDSGPHQAQSVIRDSSPPQMIACDCFDSNRGTLVLRFNEPIDPYSVNLNQLTLRSETISPLSSYNLSGGSFAFIDEYNTELEICILVDDLLELNKILGLAKERSNTYIGITDSFALDYFGNNITPATLQAQKFVADTNPVQLLSFSLDLNAGVLLLTFSHVILMVNPRAITLHSEQNGGSSHTLSLENFTIDPVTATIMMSISEYDLNQIKADLDLAVSESTTFITTMPGLAESIYNVSTSPIQGLQTTEYTPDTTGPILNGSTLDFNVGKLVLTSSEPILIKSFTPTEIMIGFSTEFYNLTDSTLVATEQANPLSVIHVELSQQDIYSLKERNQSNNVDTAFVAIGATALTDTSGNYPIPSSTLPVSFIPDTSPPTVSLFFTDFNTSRQFQLCFDEPVAISANLSITFQNAIASAAQYIISLNDTISITAPGTIELTDRAIQMMADLGIATSADTTYITLQPGTFKDFNGNTNLLIPGLKSFGAGKHLFVL